MISSFYQRMFSGGFCVLGLTLACLGADEKQGVLICDVPNGGMVPSADGKYLFLAAGLANQGEARIIDVQTGKEVHSLKHKTIEAIAVALEGDYVATACSQSIRVWETKHWKEVANFENSLKASVTAIAFSPDGKWLASAHGRDGLYFWDVPGKKRVDLLFGSEVEKGGLAWLGEGINAIAWLSEKELVAGTGRGTAVIWNTETFRSRHTFNAHKSPIARVAVSPDGKKIAAANGKGPLAVNPRESAKHEDMFLRVWDASTSEELGAFNVGVFSVTFSPDSKLLAVGTSHKFYLLDAENLKVLCKHELDRVVVGSIGFDPNGKKLFVGDKSGVRVFDVAKLLEKGK